MGDESLVRVKEGMINRGLYGFKFDYATDIYQLWEDAYATVRKCMN